MDDKEPYVAIKIKDNDKDNCGSAPTSIQSDVNEIKETITIETDDTTDLPNSVTANVDDNCLDSTDLEGSDEQVNSSPEKSELNTSSELEDKAFYDADVTLPRSKLFDMNVNFEPFEDVEETRRSVREELERLKVLEKSELRKFQLLSRLKPGMRLFPDLRRGSNFHTITFNAMDTYNPIEDDPLLPYPSVPSWKWNPDYVQMPCAPQNVRVVTIDEISNQTPGMPIKIRTVETVKMWDFVRKCLSVPITGCDDLNLRINKITNTKTHYNVLKCTVEVLMPCDEAFEFVSQTLPFMIDLCLDLPQLVTAPLPLLKRFKNYSISLTQLQIGSLLANAFFCTFPRRLANDENYPTINFEDLYSCHPDDERLLSMAHKLRCLLHYFGRLANRTEVHNGIVTYTRKCCIPARLPNWNDSTKLLSELVVLFNGTIETEGTGMLQVDFANKYLGGGVFGRGAVQEEIMFVIYPELLLSRLFTEKLYAGEAILFTGAERFSTYQGYSSTFNYTGEFFDATGYDTRGRRECQIVAIDAMICRKKLPQFNPRLMEMELNKAYAGFYAPSQLVQAPIASGKWGCGAFGGNAELKVIIQLLAASECGRNLVIFTFGDAELQKSVLAMYDVIKSKTIRDVWKLLKQYHDIFCSANENDDNPTSYTLSQFFTECVTVEDIDFKEPQVRDSKENSNTKALESQTPMNGKSSSSAVIQKFEKSSVFSDTDTESEPEIESKTPLSNIYSKKMTSPMPIGAISSSSDGLDSEGTENYHKRYIDLLNSDEDEEGTTSTGKLGLAVPSTSKCSTKGSDLKYKELFSVPRTYQIRKHPLKRKLSESPTSSRSLNVRSKTSSSTTTTQHQ